MNFVELCLTAQFTWEPVEPDGSICYQCGGECLLQMFRLFAKFKPMNDMKTKIDTNVLCANHVLILWRINNEQN